MDEADKRYADRSKFAMWAIATAFAAFTGIVSLVIGILNYLRSVHP